MENYIDGYAFPISKNHVSKYKEVAEQVAHIWKEYGALSYSEFLGDDLAFDGLKSFPDLLDSKETETVIIGWVVFKSKEDRDAIHQKVRQDPRMGELLKPLMNPEDLIFNAGRMAFGGFKPLIEK